MSIDRFEQFIPLHLAMDSGSVVGSNKAAIPHTALPLVIKVAARFVESIAAATGILIEVKKRRSSETELSVVRALQSLDVSMPLEGISEIEIAATVRSAMTAAYAKDILPDTQVRRLMSEVILAVIVEGHEGVCCRFG